MEPIVHQASLRATQPASDKTDPSMSTEINETIKGHGDGLGNRPLPHRNKEQSLDSTNPVAANDSEATTNVHEQANPPPDKEEASGSSNSVDYWQPDNIAPSFVGKGSQLCRAAIRLGTEKVVQFCTRQIGTENQQLFIPITGREVILYQPESNVGVQLQAIVCLDSENSPHETWGILLGLLYDTNSNYILLHNENVDIPAEEQEIVVSELTTSSTKPPTKLGVQECISLRNMSYRIFWHGEHLFDIEVFPRRYFSLDSQNCKPMSKGVKRALEPSSPPSQTDPSRAKRVRTEMGDVSNASTVIDTTPSTSEFRPQRRDPAGTSSVAELYHPLENLHLGSVINVANGDRMRDYSLAYKAPVSDSPDSLVFKAHHSALGKLTVVKLRRSDADLRDSDTTAGKHWTTTENWLKEVSYHGSVSQHPAIASLNGYDSRFLTLYVQHVDAPSLEFYRRYGENAYCTLNIRDARRVLCRMVDAINFVHSQGIIHNNIKPANILYSRQRGPVLIDFGYAAPEKVVHSGGTRWYIPPEYVLKEQRGRPGDIFALGVVLLFLLRKIPLPDTLSPPLTWDTQLLRESSLEEPSLEGEEARLTMFSWMDVVKRASETLRRDWADNGVDEPMMYSVTDMVSMEADTRITGPKILKNLLSRVYG